jgi:type 1 glutamine amidotransferase
MNAIRPSAILAAILAVALVLAFGSIFALAPASKSSRADERPAGVLYFTHSAGYRHEVIPASQAILKEIGAGAPRFEVAASEDVSVFTPENLRRFGAVMFFTTGELPMSEAQKAALTGFVRSGGGFLGVHSATDTFYKWEDYLKLIGGTFNEHPWHQGVRIEVTDRSSPLVGFLGPSFTISDEIYQIADFDDRGSHVLLRLDPTSVDLKADGVHPRSYGWPLAWTRSYGEGRVFYTALGHEEAVWRDPRFQHLLRNAVLWAMRRVP